MKVSLTAFFSLASSTSSRMRETVDSPQGLVTRRRSVPLWLTKPLRTSSPSPAFRGTDSPVRAAVSRVEVPVSTKMCIRDSYYAVRWGFGPGKILRLAERAFAGKYEREIILKWLKRFYGRFFSQQFKRSCLPDGPKVGSVALSPRGDWRMPSDASAALWMAELETL